MVMVIFKARYPNLFETMEYRNLGEEESVLKDIFSLVFSVPIAV